jgi:hypothetical protein
MPIIDGFRGTSVWKAFILNAIASSITISIAFLVKNQLDRRDHKKHNVPKITIKKLAITFVATFCTTLVSYGIMWILFGYGSGMTAS